MPKSAPKTLIFFGSPRRNGDTASAVKLLQDGIIGERKVVDAYRSDISPCVDCRFCKTHVGCSIKDEMQEVYDNIQECDNIVIASPIYFSELTGKLLGVLSRLQTYFCAGYFRGEMPIQKPKRGAVILVGGGDGSMEKAYDTACDLLRHMNARDIFPLVCSHKTDSLPAAEDEVFVGKISKVVDFLNREDI